MIAYVAVSGCVLSRERPRAHIKRYCFKNVVGSELTIIIIYLGKK